MFVHVVQSEESLESISTTYQVSIEQLKRVNGLEQSIVRGQALLIPSYTYIVQPGDNLIKIASKAYVTLEQLKNANPGVSNARLRPGAGISIPNISNYIAGTLGFYALRSPALDRQLINEVAPYSSSISIFEYHFSINGDIVNELNDISAIQTTWRNRVTPIVTITNLSSQGFDPNLAHQVLNNPFSRKNLVNNIYNLVARKGYGGVNIDFEQVMTEDRVLFTGFLKQLGDRLREGNFVLTVSVPPKTNDENPPWFRGYDYGGIGAAVHYMFIMAYNWHYGGSLPGPVAPINELRKTVEFAIKNVPRRKIIAGVPLYGFNWIIPHLPGRVGRSISNQDAILTAIRYKSPIQYSAQYESPFFYYQDSQGVSHEVWFEDVRSMSAKMILVREYGLQAIGAWQLTLGFAPGPWLLRKFFTIRKV
jgi:spore germination protein YaaH